MVVKESCLSLSQSGKSWGSHPRKNPLCDRTRHGCHASRHTGARTRGRERWLYLQYIPWLLMFRDRERWFIFFFNAHVCNLYCPYIPMFTMLAVFNSCSYPRQRKVIVLRFYSLTVNVNRNRIVFFFRLILKISDCVSKDTVKKNGIWLSVQGIWPSLHGIWSCSSFLSSTERYRSPVFLDDHSGALCCVCVHFIDG